jgi:hypothetical protein
VKVAHRSSRAQSTKPVVSTNPIITVGHSGSRKTARVKTYGDILREYEFHPESKCADSDGNPCTKQSIGLLQRRHVRVELVKYIGKESNSLEDAESGLVHSAQSVYTEYSDPRRDEWQTKILPALKGAPLKSLVKKVVCLDERFWMPGQGGAGRIAKTARSLRQS